MNIIFENDYGKINLSGDASSKYRILSVSGLGAVQKELSSIQYAGASGAVTLSVRDLTRTVTISFDIVSPNLKEDIAFATRLFYSGGYLKVHSGSIKRKIKCVCTSFDDPKRQGSNIASCIVQFFCDDPDFEDFENTFTPIFKRQDMLKDTFTLPCVFTRRTNQAVIQNTGFKKIEPVFHVYNTSASFSGSNTDEHGFIISNITTGKSLTLNYDMALDEKVTIDVRNARITSSSGASVINYLSDDSYLSDFYLGLGENVLVADTFSDTLSLSIVCEYSNKYIEAVY